MITCLIITQNYKTINMSQEQEVQNVPTKKEIISMLQDQIDIRELQAKLAQLNADIAVAKAKELEALSFIGRTTQGGSQTPPGNVHTITQQDLDNNPELVDEGLKVGDQVMIPTEEEVKKAEVNEAKERSKRSLKKVD